MVSFTFRPLYAIAKTPRAIEYEPSLAPRKMQRIWRLKLATLTALDARFLSSPVPRLVTPSTTKHDNRNCGERKR
jgi:hypothetical protein